MVSAAFDTYLILRDESGVEIAVDDDGGPGNNSRIQRTLEPGTYRLVASSYAPYWTGAYELTANAPPPAGAATSAMEGAAAKETTRGATINRPSTHGGESRSSWLDRPGKTPGR
jgi:tyrosinase